MKSGGQIQWNAIAICEMSKTSWQTGKLRMHEDLLNHSRDQVFHFAHWSKISQTPRETKRQSINSERKYYQGFSLGTLSSRGGFWRGDILIVDVEELEKLDASEISPRRLNAKELLISQKDGEFVCPVADGSANYQEGTKNSKNPL